MLVHLDDGVRLFTLLPQPADWPAVLAGETDVAMAGLYPYELVLIRFPLNNVSIAFARSRGPR
jgi:hypothetical protein